MSNVAPQNDVLSLAPSKTSSSDSFSKTTKTSQKSNANKEENVTQNAEDDRENFLNSLLNSIDETNEFLPDHMKISEKEVVNEAINKLQKGSFDDSDKISIFESASFMQILSLLDKLKTDTADIKLANLSSQLSQLVKTEANFNALKGANNLNELLDIAKDLGLNVKNIKVDRLLDLKATFPNLDKADFFKGVVDNVFKEIINNKIAHVSKNLNQNLQKNNPHKKDDSSLLSQTLKNLDSIIKVQENEKSKIKSDKLETLNTKKEPIQLDDLLKDIKNNKNNELDTDQESMKDILKNLNNQEDKKQNISKDQMQNLEEVDLSKNLKEQSKKSEIQNINSDKNSNKEILKDSQNLSSNLTPKDLTLKDNKTNNQDLKLNLNDQKVNFENLNKTQVVQNKDNTHLNTNKEETKNNFNLDQNKNHHDETANKIGLEDLNSLVKDLSKVNQNNTRNITPKETLQYFSNELKDAVEHYKAPITKLSITLNPNNLGEVEVTLVQRGSNLHINFNSNTNAMNLFMQHQSEFKNSLVNMGFTGLEMNFSDQGRKEQNQNKGKNRSGYGFKDAIENNNEKSNINLELVLAKYF